MRDYGKVSPKFWTGRTGKAIKKKGKDAVIVAVYLMTSPHSNMLGLFYQPLLYMAHETGLGIEGASKGLAECIEVEFCTYDEASEMVWVCEMATYQIANELKADDKRCKGIQKEYDTLPINPFLGAFFDRYVLCFHLTQRRDSEGASMPHASQEQEQEQQQEQKQEQEHEQEAGAGGAAASDYPTPNEAPLPTRENPPLCDDPAVQLSVKLRRLGINCTSAHPDVQEWAAKGVTFAVIEEAVGIARERKGNASIPPGYLRPIVNDILNPPAPRPNSSGSNARPPKFDPTAHVNRNRKS